MAIATDVAVAKAAAVDVMAVVSAADAVAVVVETVGAVETGAVVVTRASRPRAATSVSVSLSNPVTWC